MKTITILRSTTTKAPKGYPVVEVAYKSDDGKTKGMKILGFGPQKAIADALTGVEAGAVFNVEFEQNDRGYWQFKSAVPTGAKETVAEQASVPPASPSASKGNWETSEERAARQVYIVRQSSLSSAVAYLAALEPKGLTKSPNDVVDVARIFADFVFSKNAPSKDVE